MESSGLSEVNHQQEADGDQDRNNDAVPFLPSVDLGYNGIDPRNLTRSIHHSSIDVPQHGSLVRKTLVDRICLA